MYDLAKLQKAADSGNIVIDGVPEEVYHAYPAMSASGLKEFKKGPGYWKWMREHPSEDTPARQYGRLVHMALAEPFRFSTEVLVIDGHRGGAAVKEQIAAAEARGHFVCKSDLFNKVVDIEIYCKEHPLIGALLKSGKGERTMLWKDRTTGIQCKARADWITPGGVIADFKTFDPIYSDDEIERQCRKMLYHWQSAWYLNGYRECFGKSAKAFYHVFIAGEPLNARVVEIEPQSLEEAMPYIHKNLADFSECLKKGEWPMSPPEVTSIVLKPFWS